MRLPHIHADDVGAVTLDDPISFSGSVNFTTGQTDAAIREYAIREGRILVTLDVDFANVVRFPPQNTPGVIRLRASLLHASEPGSSARR